MDELAGTLDSNALMHFTTTVHHGPDFLKASGAGPALLTDLCGYIDLVATVATKGGYRRALLDLMDVEIALSFTEHLHFGAYAAERLAHLERVGAAVSAQNRKGTSEKAAQKLGLKLRTFTSLDEALAFVRQGVSPPVLPSSTQLQDPP